MFLFPTHSAFAQIEVVEFSDNSRLIRFTREDLQNMVDWYSSIVLEQEKNFVNRDARKLGFGLTCVVCSLHLDIIGLALTIVGVSSDVPDDRSLLDWGIPILVLGILFTVLGCHCSCCRGDRSAGEAEVIKKWLIRQNVEMARMVDNARGKSIPHGALGAGEVQPLLQGGSYEIPEYFLLLQRSSSPIGIEPRAFFATDRDANFAPNLRINKFARLIRDVSSKIRQRARISSRYYLTRAGAQFVKVSDSRVMPEVDSIDVVVD